MIQLPAYAPDLNPVEGAWSVMKNGLGNLAAGTTDQLAAAMRHQLDRIQRRPALINGFLGQTGLTLDPSHRRPWPFNLCSARDAPGHTFVKRQVSGSKPLTGPVTTNSSLCPMATGQPDCSDV